MKKLIALIMALCMLVGMLPAMAETATEAPAAETATDTTAEAPAAETEKVNMIRLIGQILSDIQNIAVRVDEKLAKADAAGNQNVSSGNVFAVLNKALTEVAEAMAKEGKQNEDLNKLLSIVNDPETLKNADEKELEILSSLALLAILANEEEKAATWTEEDDAKAITIASGLLKTVYEACKENETLAAAVKATDSKLFEMLEENNRQIKEYVEKNGYLEVIHLEADEKAYEEFEAEIKKLEDYLNGIEGKKQSALDLLSLLHAVLDDIHEAIDGHTHDKSKENEVDHNALVAEMMNDLGEAISKINLDDIKSKAGDKLDTTGSVYSVFEKVVKNILADEAAQKKDAEETLNKIVEELGKLDDKDVTEEEAEALFALIFVGIAASEEAAEEIDPEVDFLRASHILKATYETMMENDVIKAAIEATGSRLPEMMVNSGEMMKHYLEKYKTLHKVDDVDEAPFVAFEAEFAKVRDHIEAQESKNGGKAKALEVLDLLHEFVDDIHEAVDGHTHEDTEKQAAFVTGAVYGMNMDDVIAAIGRADYEIDQEKTNGPITFTELEYDNAAVNGMHADEHYLFVGNELVAIRVCFDKKMVTFDEAVARVSGMYGEAADVDLAVLANGIYAVDDDGKLEGKAAAVVSGDLMVVIEEDEDEVEVTYVDLTAAYILANA